MCLCAHVVQKIKKLLFYEHNSLCKQQDSPDSSECIFLHRWSYRFKLGQQDTGYQRKTATQRSSIGGVCFALPVGQLVSLPLSGWLISKFGSRQLVTAAAIFFPLTLILLGCATATWQLIAVLFFFGLWANLLNISMNTQAVGVEASVWQIYHGVIPRALELSRILWRGHWQFFCFS
jgi:MFS family permease